MGLHITLSFHQIENVVFDDVNALNADLQNTDIGELYADLAPGAPAYQSNAVFSGAILYLDPNNMKIACVADGCSEFEDYDNYTTIWGCYGPSVWQTFADHMTSGKLVFFLEIEGNPNEYFVIEPGVWKKVSASSIKF